MFDALFTSGFFLAVVEVEVEVADAVESAGAGLSGQVSGYCSKNCY